MHHFQLPTYPPRRAKELNGGPLPKLRDLGLPKVEKPQGEQPGAVINFDQQCPPSAHGHGSRADLRFDDCVDLIAQSAYGSDFRAVLIPEREMKKQIFQRADADVCQSGRHLVSHPAECGNRMLKNALAQVRPDQKKASW
jgi:hypothetical protein